MSERCAAHPTTEAEARCTECSRLLCERCFRQLEQVAVCRFCGELVLPLVTPTAEPEVLALPVQDDDLAEFDAALTTGHDRVVVPILTAIVIFSLSVYVLEARTLLLPPNPRFFFMGFWFVVAVIAIARFGLVDRYGVSTRWYSLALAFATGWSMAFGPWWNQGQAEWWAPLLNSGAFVLVWWFGTGLIASLNEQVTERESSPPGHRVGSAIVAGLAIIAFLEPLVVRSPRANVDRAFGAVIVFLAVTGVLLAVAAGRRLTLRMIRTDADASALIGPLRALLGGLMMTVILALLLALPFDVGSSKGWSDSAAISSRGERVAPGLQGLGEWLFWLLASGTLLALGWRVKQQLLDQVRSRRPEVADLTLPAESADLSPEKIEQLDPREAVIVIYHCIGKLLAGLGYERQPRQTPHEYSRSVPAELSSFAPHLDVATSAVAVAAYSSEAVSLRHRDRALRALNEIRRLAEAS